MWKRLVTMKNSRGNPTSRAETKGSREELPCGVQGQRPAGVWGNAPIYQGKSVRKKQILIQRRTGSEAFLCQ